ncbi:hypothetical protein WG66_000754 [Moniliophthora roreri]|nr:hypothetical protein WG66_000754 [Moniliophthora roreri]
MGIVRNYRHTYSHSQPRPTEQDRIESLHIRCNPTRSYNSRGPINVDVAMVCLAHGATTDAVGQTHIICDRRLTVSGAPRSLLVIAGVTSTGSYPLFDSISDCTNVFCTPLSKPGDDEKLHGNVGTSSDPRGSFLPTVSTPTLSMSSPENLYDKKLTFLHPFEHYRVSWNVRSRKDGAGSGSFQRRKPE